MTYKQKFEIIQESSDYDEHGPIQGDLLLVAHIIKAVANTISKCGREQLAEDEPDIEYIAASMMSIKALISVAGSIAMNLPVEKQFAFLDVCSVPDAEALLAAMRQQQAELKKKG